jgi:hypothetical protein
MPLKEAGDASLAKMLTQFSPKEREQESDRGVPFSTGANAPTPPSLSQASTPAAKMSDNQVENGEQSESDMEESESNRRLRCNIIKQVSGVLQALTYRIAVSKNAVVPIRLWLLPPRAMMKLKARPRVCPRQSAPS